MQGSNDPLLQIDVIEHERDVDHETSDQNLVEEKFCAVGDR